MAYEVYLDDMLLPVTPSKIQIKVNGQNKTASLINGEEINVIKASGLMDISFDAVIPQVEYPFAIYNGDFEGAEMFLDRIAELKESKGSFEFVVIRESPEGQGFQDTNIDVTLENYKVTDDTKEGLDVSVSFELKEYRHYGTKIMDFTIIENDPIPSTHTSDPERQADVIQPKTYMVVKGDCLWNIAKRLLGNGSRYREIYELNKDKISNPNLIHPGQVLTMP